MGIIYLNERQNGHGRSGASGKLNEFAYKIFAGKGLVGVLIVQVNDALVHGL
jgi:hypothetical protein